MGDVRSLRQGLARVGFQSGLAEEGKGGLSLLGRKKKRALIMVGEKGIKQYRMPYSNGPLTIVTILDLAHVGRGRSQAHTGHRTKEWSLV